MSLFGSLDLALRGDTSNLDAALNKSQQSVKSFADKAGKSAGGGVDASALGGPWAMLGEAAASGALAVAAAAAAAAVAIGAMVVSGMHDIDQLARSAATLGLTTSALAGLQHGAALAGVGTEELTHGLQHFQRELASATQGNAEANAAFARLGLTASELRELPVEQAVARFGDALQGAGSDADQLAVTLQVFGKSSAGMKEMLKGGSEGMAAMQTEAQKLGLAVSGEQAAQVQEATRGWRQFQEAIVGIGRSLAVIFAPVISRITALVNQFTGEGAGALSSNIKFWQELVNVGFDVVKAYFEVVYTLNGVIPLFNLISDAIGQSNMTWTDWRDLILRAAWATQFYLQRWKDIGVLVLSEMQLRVVQFGNAFQDVFAAIGNAGQAAWDALKRGDFEGIATSIRTAFRDAFNRPATDLETRLRDQVDRQRAALRGDLDGFLRQRMDEFNRAARPDQAPAAGQGNDAIVAKKPAAMEAGSKEAFSVLYGTQDRQQRALNVANDQLQQLRQAVAELREIRRQRQAMRRARL